MHSKRAVWMAVNSEEHGDRLVEIMHEHVSLAKKISNNLNGYIENWEVDAALNRIKQLRAERSAIIQQFEEELN